MVHRNNMILMEKIERENDLKKKCFILNINTNLLIIPKMENDLMHVTRYLTWGGGVYATIKKILANICHRPKVFSLLTEFS